MSLGCKRYLDNIVWELTLKCNAHCVHCGSAAGHDRKDNLNENELYRICDELADIDCRKVTLIGGEFFLHPLWRNIIQRLSHHDIEVAIITNGLLLNEDSIRFMADNNVSVFGISLDGPNAQIHDNIRRIPGLFNKIMNLSDIIIKSKVPAMAISTITDLNIDYLPDFYNCLSQSFFRGWQIQIGAPFGRMQQNIALNELEYYILGLYIACAQKRIDQKYFQIIGTHCIGYYSKLIPNTVANYQTNWNGCPAGKYVLGIRSNGKVIGCLSIYDDDFIEGDLRKNSLQEIWNNKDFCSWNRRVNRYKQLQGYCKECPYAIACCSGCSSMAQSYCNTIGETKLCFHKIEHKYENYQGKEAYSQIMKQIINGKINHKGFLILENGEQLNLNFINNLDINDRIKQQLKMLL